MVLSVTPIYNNDRGSGGPTLEPKTALIETLRSARAFFCLGGNHVHSLEAGTWKTHIMKLDILKKPGCQIPVYVLWTLVMTLWWLKNKMGIWYYIRERENPDLQDRLGIFIPFLSTSPLCSKPLTLASKKFSVLSATIDLSYGKSASEIRRFTT